MCTGAGVCVAQVVGPLYVEVIQHACAAFGPGAQLSRLWPQRPLDPPWSAVLEGFSAAVVDRAVVPSAARGGTPFITPRQAVFPDAMAARYGLVLTNPKTIQGF